MNLRLLLSLLCLALASLPALRAQDPQPKAAPNPAVNEALEAIATKIRSKADAGQRTAEALAPELKELDQHIATFAADKEAAGQLTFMKAIIYADVIGDVKKSRELLVTMERDLPGTEMGKQAEAMRRSMDQATQRDVAAPEIQAIVAEVMAKARAGSRTAADLAPEIAKFEALEKKHAGNREAAASVAFMKAMLHLQVLKDADKGRELLLALTKNYAGTSAAETAPQALAQLDEAAARDAAKAALIGQAAPDLNFTWASKQDLKTLSGLKGKVVVLDFWATWCGPCIRSFPQIREHVARFKGMPVEFIGVTSLQGYVANLETGRIDTKGDPAKETGLMPAFMKKHEITWAVAFSEEPVFNPAYGIDGIPFLAIIAPDGTVRHAGLHPGDPDADVAGKIEALLKEFKLPLPAKS